MDNELNNINDALLLEDERIVNYLKGRMTAEEENAFIEELKTNSELKSKAVAMARMVKGMKEVGKKMDEETTNSILASNQSEIEDIARLMKKYNISCLPVVDDGSNLEGLITTDRISHLISNY